VSRYVARRLLTAVPTLLALSFLIFTLVSVAPGDPAEELAIRRSGSQAATPADIRAAQHELHLDRPFLAQYGLWLKGALSGDLGPSFSKKRPVADEIGDRFGATVELGFAALLLILVMAVPLGVLAAMLHQHWADGLLRLGALVGASVPSFFLAYLLIIQLAVRLRLLPVAGRQGVASLVMPAIVLAAIPTAVVSRLLRAALLEVFTEDYMRTARSKGLSSLQAALHHALRNAAIPVATYLGTALGNLLEGVVITEFVFAWPGIGQLTFEAISQRDYPMIQAVVLLIGTIYLSVNLVVDVAYRFLDPRVRVDVGLERV
jgi:peptide/nickel transport system permease protein